MIRKLLIAISLTLTLSACAAKYASGPKFTEAPPPPDKKGLLYIYRVEAPLVYTPILKINDKPFVELSKLGYSYVYLSPGIYKLTFAYGALIAPLITEFSIESGEIVFKRFYDSGTQMELKDVPKDKGFEEIKEYSYIVPLNSEF